jgi:hypothetical protein
MATYSIGDLGRREILKMSAVPAAKELLITKLLAPSPEFEPDSKMVIFDMVLYQG